MGCEPIPVSVDVGSKGSPAVGDVLMPLQTSAALVLGASSERNGLCYGQAVFKAKKF